MSLWPSRQSLVRPGRSHRLSLCLPLLILVSITGCAHPASQTPSGARTATASQIMPLDQVTPLSRPKNYQGPSTAVLDGAPIEPVVEQPTPALPATVTDAQGTAVTVTDASRILALDLYGTTARIVFDLGLGDRVVGRDLSSGFPEIADRPLVTVNGHSLNAESILQLAPSVIITDTSLGPWDVVLQMRDAGIPVVVVSAKRDIDTTGPLIHQVADALGVSAAGDALADRTAAQIADTGRQIDRLVPPDPADRLRLAFLYLRGQAGVYYLFGQGSGVDSLITAVGGIDVASETGWQGMRPVTDEGLVAASPDAILLMTDGLESVGGVDGLLERIPAITQTPAGAHRRIIDLDDRAVLSFGPLTPQVMAALARALYAPGSLEGRATP